MEAASSITERVAHVLECEVIGATVVHGGDVASAFRVRCDGGRVVFAKTHHDPPPDFFETEATGLAWLRSAGAVEVPAVLAVEANLLVLEWIDVGRAGPTTESEFGRGLARLHRSGAPTFGREDRRTTGSRRLPNEPTATWAEFFAANRLLPLARLARDAAALPEATIAGLVDVAGRLDAAGAADEAPARLHGDLWAGNRLVDQRARSWLIDPAAHGGHREFDLAMMLLFGGFGDAVYEAYHDTHPLADGWRDRVPLHQLAPLAVHAIKFGGPYVEATGRAVARCRRAFG